jgi:hypothetical protein
MSKHHHQMQPDVQRRTERDHPHWHHKVAEQQEGADHRLKVRPEIVLLMCGMVGVQ